MKESVLVVPSISIDNINDINSVKKSLQDGYFADRELAEVDETHKQIIPYVMITNEKDQVLAYKRSKKGGEGRLYDKWSVGFGGHVNPEDILGEIVDFESFYYSINRELTEELVWGDVNISFDDIKVTKTIYDDSNEVGRVHLGLLFEMKIEQEGSVYPKIDEDAIEEIVWITKNEAWELENLEEWSKIALMEDY